MSSIDKERKVVFLQAESLRRTRPRRNFPFAFKITDIEGGPVLPEKTHLELVVDNTQPRLGRWKRLMDWIVSHHPLLKPTFRESTYHNQLAEAWIAQYIEQKGMKS